jgi:hypothetical protein
MAKEEITKAFFHLGGRVFPVGDRLESALKATGIHQAVKTLERLTGKDCGCAKRKQRLNELGERLAAALHGEPDPPAPPPD